MLQSSACAGADGLARSASAPDLARHGLSRSACAGLREIDAGEAEAEDIFREYCVSLVCGSGAELGLELGEEDPSALDAGLAIGAVREGLIEQHNKEKPHLKVKIGDRLVEANGYRIPWLVRSQLSAQGVLRLTLRRELVSRFCIPVEPMAADALGCERWRIRGVYVNQVLRLALQVLHEEFDAIGIQLPVLKKRFLLKERLLKSIADGERELKAVPVSEVTAAQSDVKSLPLGQLLKLKISCLDLGSGGALGAVHAAFLQAIDTALFPQLGRAATGGADPSDGDAKVGREALMFFAASTAISEPKHWSWWVTDERHVFFDAKKFASDEAFPEGGVLEVADTSYEDSGAGGKSSDRRWMEWKVRHARVADELQTAEQREAELAKSKPMQMSLDMLQQAMGALKNKDKPPPAPEAPSVPPEPARKRSSVKL